MNSLWLNKLNMINNYLNLSTSSLQQVKVVDEGKKYLNIPNKV